MKPFDLSEIFDLRLRLKEDNAWLLGFNKASDREAVFLAIEKGVVKDRCGLEYKIGSHIEHQGKDSLDLIKVDALDPLYLRNGLLFRLFRFQYNHGCDATCLSCSIEFTCKYSWDLYNTNGDCLAEK